MKIYDLDKCLFSRRHGTYGGQAGNKDGIIIDKQEWIVKYPKNTSHMKGDNLAAYTTAPLSEYIGSHIYKILGIDVHETILGIRQGKLVVACKDFRKKGDDFAEMRSIKNGANKELNEVFGKDFDTSASGDRSDLDEILFHLQYNPILLQVKNADTRFWDMSVIDILINNNDRNNGNWGLLIDEDGHRTLAPVYDNGNSFNNKLSNESLRIRLNDEKFAEKQCAIMTSFEKKGKIMYASAFLKEDEPGLKQAIIKIVPEIKKQWDKINNLIDEIPEEFNGMKICSQVQKKYYKQSMIARYNHLLLPIYKELVENKERAVKSPEEKSTTEKDNKATDENPQIKTEMKTCIHCPKRKTR